MTREGSIVELLFVRFSALPHSFKRDRDPPGPVRLCAQYNPKCRTGVTIQVGSETSLPPIMVALFQQTSQWDRCHGWYRQALSSPIRFPAWPAIFCEKIADGRDQLELILQRYRTHTWNPRRMLSVARWSVKLRFARIELQ